ncbi:S16 family serine protease [Streptomyces gamaensis]|uniref:S16 family serine protease n=1 Tax=Streptomyces gamaensis TaxID=1763542 RepID=A0ABW0Z5J5_9ACTN
MPAPTRTLFRSARARTLAICAAPVVALLAVAALAPLPFTIAQPGGTVNVLGADSGKQVISLKGVPGRTTDGQLRMTTIVVTGPQVDVRLRDVVSAWFRTDRAVMPRSAVYPAGSAKENEQHNAEEMKKSQTAAEQAALNYLHRSPDQVKVDLNLADVGGPSAGLLFTLGIIDKIDGDGRGGDLTGGKTIAGTGTIAPNGDVGEVGGVPLKTQAAKRDGASVFLLPRKECAAAKQDSPKGLRLVPVDKLNDAVDALKALAAGQDDKVPSCAA